MAETLTTGIVIPQADGKEPISDTGIREMRTLGVTADAAITAASPYRGVLLNAEIAGGLNDVFTLPAGVYTVPNAVIAAQIANLPEALPGTIEKVVNSGSPVASVKFSPHGQDYAWETQTQDVSGAWMPWRKISAVSDTVPGSQQDLGQAHAARRAIFKRRRGGVIGTGGRPAIALRWDHGLNNFRDLILPHLVRLGLPGSMAMNSADNRWALDESNAVTPAQLGKIATDHGIEIWNHAQTHGAAESLPSLTREIATGLTDLQAKIPTVPIEGFVIPGVPSGNYAGFAAGETAARWDTMAGRLIMGHHAVSTSHMAGTAGPLGGDQPILGRQLSIDSMTETTIKAEVDDLIATGQGSMILFLHPSQVGLTGRLSLAGYVAVLEYIAAKRAAGEVEVLTMGGLSVADQGRTARPAYAPLLNAMSIPQPLPAGGQVTRTRTLGGRSLWAQGAPREIVVDLDVTTAGTVEIFTGSATTVEYTVGTGRQTLRRPIILPATATALSVGVRSVTAVGTVAQVADYPI